MIRAILACDDEWGIGKNGDLPWPYNPADLRWFKECTTGGVVAMGRATWESLPTRPLPNRNNVVITSSEQDKDQGSYHYVKFETAAAYLQQMSLLQDVWIIGGAQLVEGLLPIIDEFWLSRISGNYHCDVYLPRDAIELGYEMTKSQREAGVYVETWSKR